MPFAVAVDKARPDAFVMTVVGASDALALLDGAVKVTCAPGTARPCASRTMTESGCAKGALRSAYCIANPETVIVAGGPKAGGGGPRRCEKSTSKAISTHRSVMGASGWSGGKNGKVAS